MTKKIVSQNNLETEELGKFLYSENIINFSPNFAEHSEDNKININSYPK